MKAIVGHRSLVVSKIGRDGFNEVLANDQRRTTKDEVQIFFRLEANL
jgi:hypothetical protein